MSPHGHTTITTPTGGWSPARPTDRGRRFVLTHAVDLDLGGHPGDPWGLAALSLLTAAALVVRLGQLGWVVGEVTTATSPMLARFVRQKTVLVTTYRQDGRPVGTPVSLAVDGDHAYLRSFEQAGKTRCLHHDPRVEVSPSTARGRPTGPAVQATARRLEGAESRHAARLLARKHPVLHGVLVPMTHRLGRAKTGKTVHFQLTPRNHGQVHPNARLLEAFYQAQAAFYAGGDDTTVLRGLLADEIVWHVPGRSLIAGHYHGHPEVMGYFAARRAHAKATFRVRPRAILADDDWAVQLAEGRLDRDGQLRTWQTVGVFRIADGRIAESWLVPFDQYLFDELWS